ncbi:hypothetical protein MTR67_035318 [Solanum verrucosum]|uniref:Integrase zinc-binding domain-containing protein n=1 Tax=Solanum verrucosum TaxID=315347 RepID=A0AAF0U9B6_SOLVR|nr:hypothetical protein MTR67_035318 [Solanum verrucosum]
MKAKQDFDPILVDLKRSIFGKAIETFSQRGDGILHYQGRLCVPNVDELRNQILVKAHNSQYSIYLGATKMSRDLREVYWWNEMSRDIVEFVAKCLNCQQVKVNHQKLDGLAQETSIPTCKCEDLNMDFVTGLPSTHCQFDSIWVIVNQMTKSAHFLPVKTLFSGEDYVKLYIREMKGFGTQVKLSMTFHPLTDGQAKHTIQTLVDMLRACVIDFQDNWDDHLHLIKFAYNNSYHSSIGMIPFEALYGRRCRSLIVWFEVSELVLIGPRVCA